jgi:hypothetical protein
MPNPQTIRISFTSRFDMQNIQQILQSDPLVKLIQKENFIGWVYSIDYDSACVITNDLWKANSLGIPHNCFLDGWPGLPVSPSVPHDTRGCPSVS